MLRALFFLIVCLMCSIIAEILRNFRMLKGFSWTGEAVHDSLLHSQKGVQKPVEKFRETANTYV